MKERCLSERSKKKVSKKGQRRWSVSKEWRNDIRKKERKKEKCAQERKKERVKISISWEGRKS